MTAKATRAGATSHHAADWHAINWRQVHHTVRRLQSRIVKAIKENRWGKARALQHLLARSFSGKALAVRRVTENSGKRTPGVDQIIWDTPAKKVQAVQELRQRGYTPRPLKRVYIEKSSGNGRRPLSIPAMKDRAMQALYLLALDPIAETTADPNSYGFRVGRSTADAIEQCFNSLGRKNSSTWVLEGDIKSCFDRLDHDWLLAHIPMERAILNKWLKAGFMEQSILHPTTEGMPQGGIASPVIANLALDGLERKLRASFPVTNSRGKQAKINITRYADDFIVTGCSRELLETMVKPVVEQHLNERGVALSTEKTRITQIEEGFDFLGQNVRKYKGRLVIKPSKGNVKAFLRKVRKVINGNKEARAGNLIRQLNPIIKGWAQYHQHVASKRIFADVDHALFESLWRWAKRRHPHKPKTWIKAKYFTRVRGNNWVFYGEAPGAGKSVHRLRLYLAAMVRITKHIKVRGAANPYDPQWEPYFEQRLDVKTEANIKGLRQLLNLWQEQRGLCPVCQEKITKITGWHSHHIVWRVHGGTDKAENRVLLHPNCHRQVHSQKLEVRKPRFGRSVTEA